jgi:hypothetical protein
MPAVVVATSAVGFDVVDAKLTAPRLYLVIVDAYQFGVGGDCSDAAVRAARRQRRDAVRAVRDRQVQNRDFADVARPVEVECTDFGGLSRAVVDELRRSDGTPKLARCAQSSSAHVRARATSIWRW